MSYLSFLVRLYIANIGILFNKENFLKRKTNELPLFNERNTAYSSDWLSSTSIKTPPTRKSFITKDKNTN